MPEGDTIWHAARRLRDTFAGRELLTFDLRVPAHATADLRGHRVAEVLARGKHLLIRVDSGHTLHLHFGMSGSIRVSRNRGWVPGPRAARVRVVLANADRLAVGTDVPQVDLLPTSAEDRLVGHLGPDLLGPDWDPAVAVANLSADPDRPVTDALLDQRVLAGIGNVYRNELMFLRGIHPTATVAEAGDPDRLVRLARQLLWANRHFPAHVTTGDRRPDHRHWVYGRAGEPCRRCGTLIQRAGATDGVAAGTDRVTYWCPHCQPSPPTERNGRLTSAE